MVLCLFCMFSGLCFVVASFQIRTQVGVLFLHGCKVCQPYLVSVSYRNGDQQWQSPPPGRTWSCPGWPCTLGVAQELMVVRASVSANPPAVMCKWPALFVRLCVRGGAKNEWVVSWRLRAVTCRAHACATSSTTACAAQKQPQNLRLVQGSSCSCCCCGWVTAAFRPSRLVNLLAVARHRRTVGSGVPPLQSLESFSNP